MKTIVKITTICVILFFVSCKPVQKIVYNIDKYQPSSESINVSISIQTFNDIRSESDINQIQLQAKNLIETVKSNRSCINAENLYKVPVGQQMADMFAKYLGKKAYFTKVLFNQKENADYYVTANVKHFFGHQKYSTKAVVGSQFGLIGALATSSLKTEGEIIIELSDIYLYDKNNVLIAKIGDFKKDYNGDFSVDANCYCIYRNINQCLSEFNEELGEILFREVKK
jgi:hypothetical protein